MKLLIFTSLIVTLLLGVQAGPEDMSPELKAAIESCKGKFPNVKEEIFKKMCTPGFTTTDNDVKCFGKCVGELTRKLDANGKLNIEELKAHPMPSMSADDIAKIAQECGSKMGADACDTAYQQWTCMVNMKM